jgi:hypothetical protein
MVGWAELTIRCAVATRELPQDGHGVAAAESLKHRWMEGAAGFPELAAERPRGS